jgi:hypothetical protein
MSENYCTNCLYRSENVRHKGGQVDFVKLPGQKFITNRSRFCWLGYTQNPMTLEASESVLRNKGKLCRFNPFFPSRLS